MGNRLGFSLTAVQASTLGITVERFGVRAVTPETEVPARFVGVAFQATPYALDRQRLAPGIDGRPSAGRLCEVKSEIATASWLDPGEIHRKPMRNLRLAQDGRGTRISYFDRGSDQVFTINRFCRNRMCRESQAEAYKEKEI